MIRFCAAEWRSDRRASGLSMTPALLGWAVALLACVAPCIALAQEQAEVPLGTFHLQGRGVAVGESGPGSSGTETDNGSAAAESRQWLLQRFEAGLQEAPEARQILLQEAEHEIKKGKLGAAQRLFERLIAEAPDTDEAKAARTYLAKLYREAGTEKDKPLDIDKSSRDESAEAGNLPSQKDGQHSIGQALKASPALDDEFVSQVGDRVFFSPGSAELGSRALYVAQSQARFLSKMQGLAVVIEGHSDDGPLSDEENERLSAARAAAVRDRLVAEGVDGSRIKTVSKGRRERISSCPDAECQAQNRRAVTVIMSNWQPAGFRSAQSKDALPSLQSPQPATQ